MSQAVPHSGDTGNDAGAQEAGGHGGAHGGSTRAIVAALLANLGIAVTKFIAFLLTHSSSMLAEAIHSVADSGNQVLLLVGGKRATRSATPQHPFGYGRERYIYAFIVSIVLFSVGGLFALYEGIHKLQHPEPIDKWQWVPITVLSTEAPETIDQAQTIESRTDAPATNFAPGSWWWAEKIGHSSL